MRKGIIAIMKPENEAKGMRAQILATAKSLFIQQGYHGLAMQRISDALGVTKAALYYHFKDKEELFLAVLTDYLDEMETALDQIMAKPATCREKTEDFMEYVLVQPAEQRAIIRLASQEMSQLSAPARKTFERVYRKKFIGKVEAILTSGMERGEFKRIRPEVATWTLLGMMYPYFYPTNAGSSGLSDETIQQILSVFLDGVACSQ